MISIAIHSFINLQALMNSPFVTLLSFTLYSAKVACPKDHVRACYPYTCSPAIFDYQVGTETHH